MSFVRLSEIPRTISFRTGLVFLGLFGCSFLALFGYVYWQTAVYLKTEADTLLYRQVENRSAQDPQLQLREIRNHAAQDADGRMPHSLFDQQGQFLAGAIEQLPPFTAYDKPQEFRWKKANGHHRPVRFIVHRLADGKTLLVAQDIHDIREFDELLIRALVSGGVLLLVVGLFGAVVLGYSAHRRLDKVSRSIKGIIEGDLTGRLPVRGNNDDIDAALNEAKSLLLTFKALLRISEIEDSARRSHFAPLDLNLISADAVELYEPLAQERDINLTLEPARFPAVMPGDAQLLFDAICNLLDNAIKFCPDHSAVRLTVISEPNRVGLCVTDNGPGIAQAEQEAVLRRLYRAEASRHTPGNGLGLSMVSAVARLHDMKLSISDAAPGCRIELTTRRTA
ncbi:sensor histidine kinase [Pseudomonas fragi]|uniref:sensor histidine kinase n=1 Tax=Pseudomonas fragi TaxID=296 RepID=UPI001474EAFD|nr:ATP-binding protein [Pseudomonas fragi]NNB29878.1 two-component sensor histidine kinase [Pseudomonas fragi]